ncbi:MAG: hypothetical protein AAGJ52_10730 [Pseudomonadota bacterium]
MSRVKLVLAALALALVMGNAMAQQQSPVDLKAIWDSLTPEEQASALAQRDQGPWEAPLGTSGDTCDVATELSGSLPFNTSGSTIGASDSYLYGGECGGFNASSGDGPDVSFIVQVDQACDLNVAMTPAANDLALYVTTDCDDIIGGCVAGNDAGGNAATENAPFSAVPGTDYFIVVDGFGGDSDDFTLDITETTATGCALAAFGPPPPPPGPVFAVPSNSTMGLIALFLALMVAAFVMIRSRF